MIPPAAQAGPFWARMLASWGGVGFWPKAPGTWGSLAALPFAWVIAWLLGPLGLVVAAIAAFLLGWIATRRFVGSEAVHDPQWIVVDEVAAQWLTLAVAGRSPLAYAVGFVAFRIADIVKPFPANWADRQVKGAFGVMLDDVFAAVYAAAATALFRWLIER